ncbi:Sec-dependent nitrous-oxide reductase [Salinibacter ruber]|uniref:Nitrous-oxide reductase n=1 Tax=Salinibacter ruber TaxID=146919 RepID=A0A9X2V623_9BACT|nr:Sec-dependent nitrous-oxide reductase [Salinibacter ruber]MCS4121935.1 nitrous-oxide reductase [Salinibacter ruber]
MASLTYLFLLVLPLGLLGCGGSSASDDGAPASYVPPGEKDDYYLFYSGGHSGQVFVAGLPSLREIQEIPVFTPSPGHGYGFSKKSKKMMGEYRWGDVHHPGLSKTDGTYDGRWLFVNDNANNRVARISLRDFKTKQILGPIPNSMGNHGSSFVTPNTEYLLVATRFSVPLPKGTHAPVETYEENFNGIVSGVDIDPETGEMEVGWQVKTPPFNWDLGSTGKGPSDGWAFWTSYNTEMAHDSLEINASQRDRDYAAFVNWERAEEVVENNEGLNRRNGVPLIDPAEHEGVMYFVPVSKSPHGIDASPSGRWIAASGKLQPTTTVFDFKQFKTAIENEDFQGEFRGVPVVNYDAVVEGEVPVGQGPLHTQFDGEGNAYTSLFIESSVTKWKLPPWDKETTEDMSKAVTDKISVHYNIGHLVIPGSDTKEPYGNWLVAMNKLQKGRGLNVGPEKPETSQLIDISGEEMEMIEEDYTRPEPHFAQAVPADVINPIEVYKKENNDHPDARWDPENTGVERTGPDEVTVHMIAKRSQYNMNGVVPPGDTQTFTITADEAGVYPFYCTNFCSALHQEMQGYLEVKPR